MKILILGTGNTFLSDDGVGIRVVQEIKKRLKDIDVAETNSAGISILDYIRGYDKVVIIDSVISESIPPGSVKEFSIDQIEKSYPFLSHGINLPLAIEFGKRCGEDIPHEITIYGIGTKDTATFKEGCTPEVEKAIPGIVEYIIKKEFYNTPLLTSGGSNG